MMTLAQIMTADPVTVGPETSLREVIDVLSSHRISGVPVVAGGGRVLGVVSGSDILAFTASMPGVPRDADDEWDSQDNGSDDDPYTSPYAGYWNDAGADVVARMHADARPERDQLDEHTVAEVMTRKLHSMDPAASLTEAAVHMVDAGIHRLLVVEGGRLVGVVSTMDFVRAVAKKAVAV